MNLRNEIKPFLIILAVFLIFYNLPVGTGRFDNAVMEAFYLVKWYSREHVVLCLLPAFFIAGAIGVFISQASVMKYLGPSANKLLAYSVASVSGSVLAVCSCTVLPLFAGIHKRGAGLGPACAFLYSGPAINILAIILTARILGFEMGAARAIGAVLFSVVIGLLMHLIFKNEETENAKTQAMMPAPDVTRPLWQNSLFLATMIAVLVFANWGKPDVTTGTYYAIWSVKWPITSVFALILGFILTLWFKMPWWKVALMAIAPIILAVTLPGLPVLSFAAGTIGLGVITGTSKGEMNEWFCASWDFAKQITPLLLFGVLAAGLLLGRPEHEGLIPSSWVASAVGGNSLISNFFAAIVGAFMYFATLTEIPILQGLIGSGMGKGPALALLLAGPALSLPSMLVLNGIMGTKKTVVYVALVVVMSTIVGMFYGNIFG